MGYADAIRDGIRLTTEGKRRGYYPRCQFCGSELFTMNYRSGVLYTCSQCRPLKKLLLAAGISSQHERKCD